MKFTAAVAGLVATVAAADLAPTGSAPAGCSKDFNGAFELSVFKISKRELVARDALTVKLANGALTDAQGRVGSIVANYQFQFDPAPGQAGAIYTSGFSACQNGSLALGSSTVFYQCLSGGFYNLYDRHWAAQCEPITLVIRGKTAAPNPGQPDNGKHTVGTSMQMTTIITQIGDGQPQAIVTQVPVPLCQIGDGQVQAVTTPCDKVPNNPPVSQIGDGQIQAPTKVPVITQIGDGQVQAPKPTGGAPVSQIGDGQVQAPTGGKPVSQIGDGQVQAPTGGAPVSQIGDGQVQAPTGGAPVSQIGDGQVQAPTGKPATVPTGGAGQTMPALGALFAAGMAAVFFL